MSPARCPREEELLQALERRFLGAELDEHCAACPSCGELRQVAEAFLDDRRAAIAEAAVPSAGTTWWRMQLRRRQEAQDTARRSLLVGQAVTLAVAAVAVASIFGEELAAGIRQTVTSFPFSTPVLLMLATWLLAAPIGGYLATRQK